MLDVDTATLHLDMRRHLDAFKARPLVTPDLCDRHATPLEAIAGAVAVNTAHHYGRPTPIYVVTHSVARSGRSAMVSAYVADVTGDIIRLDSLICALAGGHLVPGPGYIPRGVRVRLTPDAYPADYVADHLARVLGVQLQGVELSHHFPWH